MHWTSGYSNDYVAWRDNEPFEATVTFTGMTAGYSAKYLTVVDEAGKSYPMFVKDALGVLQVGTVANGKCTGTWVCQKRGANYGLKLVES